MAKKVEKETEMVETEKEVFESFIASLEQVQEDITEVVKKGYEILGIEVEEAAEEGDEEGVDIDTLDMDGLLEAAESYQVDIPAKLVAKGDDAVREFLKAKLGLEEEEAAEEAEAEEEPEEITTKVKAKLKQEIAKKKLKKK